jgi:hypothetical protein
MAKDTVVVDITSNGATEQRTLLAEKNAQNEFAIARSLATEDGLVNKSAPLPIMNGLMIPAHNFISAVPSFDNTTDTTTITFRNGGSSGTIVATIVLTYDASNNLVSVAKT